MDIMDALQLIGGIILSVGYIPQIRRIAKTKSVKDFDFQYLLSLFIGIGLMEVYAIHNFIQEIAVMFFVTNTIAFALSATMLILYIRYNK